MLRYLGKRVLNPSIYQQCAKYTSINPVTSPIAPPSESPKTSAKSYNAEKSVSERNAILSQLKDVMPNVNFLHSRIDTLLDSSSLTLSQQESAGTQKIALVPYCTERSKIKGYLDKVIGLKNSEKEWFPIFLNRGLSKNTVLKFPPEKSDDVFLGGITHNSIVEYEFDFKTPSGADAYGIQLLEAWNLNDSVDQVVKCHRVVLLCDNLEELKQHLLARKRKASSKNDLETQILDFPHDVIVDVSKPNIQKSDYTNLKLADGTIVKVIKSGQDGQDLDPLIQSLFGRTSAQATSQLIHSVLETARNIHKSQSQDFVLHDIGLESKSINSATDKWTSDAHNELQTTLKNGWTELFRKRLPWWKLYGKVDDVGDTGRELISYYYLPRSADKLEYLCGRIDQFADDHHFPPPISSNKQALEIDSIIKTHQKNLQSTVCEELQTRSLSLFLQSLSVQIPLTVLPLISHFYMSYPLSMYSTGSAILLGWVVGFARLQKGYMKLTNEFLKSVELVGQTTVKDCKSAIAKRWEWRVQKQIDSVKEREKLLAELEKYV